MKTPIDRVPPEPATKTVDPAPEGTTDLTGTTFPVFGRIRKVWKEAADGILPDGPIPGTELLNDSGMKGPAGKP